LLTVLSIFRPVSIKNGGQQDASIAEVEDSDGITHVLGLTTKRRKHENDEPACGSYFADG
jgi:hypothetical protein